MCNISILYLKFVYICLEHYKDGKKMNPYVFALYRCYWPIHSVLFYNCYNCKALENTKARKTVWLSSRKMENHKPKRLKITIWWRQVYSQLLRLFIGFAEWVITDSEHGINIFVGGNNILIILSGRCCILQDM